MPLDDEFWQEEDEQANELALLLTVLFLMTISYSVRNTSTVFENGEQITEEQISQVVAYPFLLTSLMQNTTREQVERVLNRWDGEGDLGELLDGIFGPSRASRIAVTETTRALMLGAVMAQEVSGKTTQVPFMTAHDERVCEICGPLDGVIMELGDPNMPPLHPYCRCTTIPVEE